MFYAFNSLVHGKAFIDYNSNFTNPDLDRHGHPQSAINYRYTLRA